MSDEIRSDEPHERLTLLCAEMIDVLEASPEWSDGMRCIIMLDDMNDERGGLAMHGYSDEADVVANMFGHLQAILRTHGADVQIIHAFQRNQG